MKVKEEIHKHSKMRLKAEKLNKKKRNKNIFN